MKQLVLQGWLCAGLFGAVFVVGCMQSPCKRGTCTCPRCGCESPVMHARMRDVPQAPYDRSDAGTVPALKPTEKPVTQAKAEPPKSGPNTLVKKQAPTAMPADPVPVAKALPKPVSAPLVPMKVIDVKAEKAAAQPELPAVAAAKMPPLVPVSVVASKPEAAPTAFSDSDGSKACAHAPDYTWLVGELQYLHVRKAWRIRYAPVDEEDRYGGSVTFADTGAISMANYQNGQIIRVEGKLRNPEAREPSPAYLVKSIQVLR